MKPPLSPVVDKAAIQDSYLTGLKTCFSGWGDEVMFEWCFRRECGGPSADLFMASGDSEPLAGTAVTYRSLSPAGTRTRHRVAIMTGSWTMPSARGQGYFTSMVEQSREQARSRNAAWLIAFANAANKSANTLRRNCQLAVPAWQVMFPPQGRSRKWTDLEPEPIGSTRDRIDRTHFAYSEKEAAGQFLLRRPNPVRLGRPAGGRAIIQEHAEVDRLLYLANCDLCDVWSELAGEKPLLAYTLDPAAAELAMRERGEADRADIYVLDCGSGLPIPTEWQVDMGDKI